jgi:hypothetical protein
MSKITVIFASLALLGSTQAFGQTVKITDSNQGRYDLNGQESGDSGSLANYIAGQIVSLPDPANGVPGETNNFADFFSFDVSGLKSIRSASIEISGGQNVFNSGPNGVFNLYASPVDPATHVAGFEASLTPGNLIGSVQVTNGGTISSDNPTTSDVVVQLNAVGLADLSAVAGLPGAQFFVGGTFTGAAGGRFFPRESCPWASERPIQRPHPRGVPPLSRVALSVPATLLKRDAPASRARGFARPTRR